MNKNEKMLIEGINKVTEGYREIAEALENCQRLTDVQPESFKDSFAFDNFDEAALSLADVRDEYAANISGTIKSSKKKSPTLEKKHCCSKKK